MQKKTSNSPIWSAICLLVRGDHPTPRQAKSRIGKFFTLDLSSLLIRCINAVHGDAPSRPRGRLGEIPEATPASPSKSVSTGTNNTPLPFKMPASMPLSAMLNLGKLITPKTDVVTLTLEEFLSRT